MAQSAAAFATNRFAQASRKSALASVKLKLLFGVSGLCLGLSQAQAQDATWRGATSSDWNTAPNWTPPTVPTNTAHFDAGAVRTPVSFFTPATIGTLQFAANAPAFTFLLRPENLVAFPGLTITGQGIVNNSAFRPTFRIACIGGGDPGRCFRGGFLTFRNASTAGNADITVDSLRAPVAATLTFADQSNAGSARITNNNGQVSFLNSSSAGTATIVNQGSFVGLGVLSFRNTSTAGAATITTNVSGRTDFRESSTAGSGTLITSDNGNVSFSDTSTAGNATVITNAGGRTTFTGSSSGGRARFVINDTGVVDAAFVTTPPSRPDRSRAAEGSKSARESWLSAATISRPSSAA